MSVQSLGKKSLRDRVSRHFARKHTTGGAITALLKTFHSAEGE